MKEIGEIYERCKSYTLTSKTRIYALYKAVEYIVNSKIPGDFVECGVYKGGSCMVIAYALKKMNDTNRKIYLYDTYEGMTAPTDVDISTFDGESAKNKYIVRKIGEYSNWWLSPIEEVKDNVFSTEYPKKNLIFVKGKVEDTIPNIIPKKIALLRLDTDWYESTKHEMNFLFPLVVARGVLIIDDYGCWEGSKKAVDEYMDEKNVSILLNRIDGSGRIGIKNN